MNWYKYFTGITLALLMTVSGCLESPETTGVDQSLNRVGAQPTAAVTAWGPIMFSEDFETGIDPVVWYREVVNGAQWQHTTSGGNGYIYCTSPSPKDGSNRNTDILSERSDFSDFQMTWDMRFRSEGGNADLRTIYFRSDKTSLAQNHGYEIIVGVNRPSYYSPRNQLMMGKKNVDDTWVNFGVIEYPWVQGQWYTFKLEAIGNSFKLKVWLRSSPEPTAWTYERVDVDATYAAGSIGFGNYWYSLTDVDNVVVRSTILSVDLDIKPGSCPNPLNTKSMGVLPVAILGTADFDVEEIDVSTVLLENVQPLRHSYDDVGMPAGSGELCECVTGGPDGYNDLTLKFKTAIVAEALGPLMDGGLVPLTITGQLLDGTEFEGIDCVVIKAKGGKEEYKQL